MSDDLDNSEESNGFSILTMCEAIANHAFGEDLISVRLDDQDVRIAYVILNSSPEKEIEFDYLNYYIKSKELFTEEESIEIFLLIAKFSGVDI
jgi:hypothetical protein